MLKLRNCFKIAESICLNILRQRWRIIIPQMTNNDCHLGFLKNQLTEIATNLSEADLNIAFEMAMRIMKFQSVDIFGAAVPILNDIDWHTDIKSNYTWECGKYYTDYKTIDLSNSSDVKGPWELSRCQHLLWLSLFYYYKKDKNYAKEVLREINLWIDNNPFPRSINWTCSMEVAYRAVNWLYSLCLLSDSGLIDGKFKKKLLNSLYQHGAFIYGNLETDGKDNANHYMSNLVGLVYLGFFLNNKASRQWLRFSIKEIEKETNVQFGPSGFHYENTSAYHRLMAEMLVNVSWVLEDNNLLPKGLEERIANIVFVTSLLRKNNGLYPALGDEDNGRFFPLVPRQIRDSSDVLNTYFLWKHRLFQFRDSFFILDNKLAIVKKYGYDLFVNNAGLSRNPIVGKYCLSHTHCDLLSFELSTNKGDYIIDPGTYTYTSDVKKRTEYRSTKKHNTISVDDEEQYVIDPNKPFSLLNIVEEKSLKVGDNGKIIIEGSYRKSPNYGGLCHKRSFQVEENRIIIKDHVIIKGNHYLTFNLHLSPSAGVDVSGPVFVLWQKDEIIELNLDTSGIMRAYTLEKEMMSNCYGLENETKFIHFEIDFQDECEIELSLIRKK